MNYDIMIEGIERMAQDFAKEDYRREPNGNLEYTDETAAFACFSTIEQWPDDKDQIVKTFREYYAMQIKDCKWEARLDEDESGYAAYYYDECTRRPFELCPTPDADWDIGFHSDIRRIFFASKEEAIEECKNDIENGFRTTLARNILDDLGVEFVSREHDWAEAFRAAASPAEWVGGGLTPLTFRQDWDTPAREAFPGEDSDYDPQPFCVIVGNQVLLASEFLAQKERAMKILGDEYDEL